MALTSSEVTQGPRPMQQPPIHNGRYCLLYCQSAPDSYSVVADGLKRVKANFIFVCCQTDHPAPHPQLGSVLIEDLDAITIF